MKYSNKHLLAGCLAAAMLASCSENAWNDHLDGFAAPDAGGSDVQAIDYVLSAADYAAIAKSSANKAIAASLGQEKALEAVASNGCFANTDDAHRYIPAFLSSTDFKYFALDNKSSLNIQFAIQGKLPAAVAEINAGTRMLSVSEEDYQEIWGSDDDYIQAFSPAKPATGALPKLLREAYPDAVAGQWAVADYKWSDVNPVFGNAGGGETYWETDVLTGLAVGDEVSVKGIVTGLCARGFVVSDRAGSILCYQANDFDPANVPLFSKVEVSGPVSAFGTALQIAISDNYKLAGAGEYTYPVPERYTYDDVEAECSRQGNYPARYITFEATCAISGNYTNFIFDDGSAVDASAYMLPKDDQAQLSDGARYSVTGWMVSVSSGKHLNVVITECLPAGAASAQRRTIHRAPAAEISGVQKFAAYRYNGEAWVAAPSDVYLVQPEDYALMNLSYGNFSSSALPGDYLPRLLSIRYPFAADGVSETVLYKWYASSVTSYEAKAFSLTQGAWILDNGHIPVTEQFVRSNNVWNYDPSITLTFTRDRIPYNQDFYQECVDWVYQNKCVPLGSTDIKSGMFWVTSYGNNEYWSGTSAYQCNLDIRPAAARGQYAAGFEGMDDQQVMDFIMTNFCQATCPAVLAKRYPDLGPVDGIDVTITVNFIYYTGSNNNATVVYNVTAPGKFEYASCTYFDN